MNKPNSTATNGAGLVHDKVFYRSGLFTPPLDQYPLSIISRTTIRADYSWSAYARLYPGWAEIHYCSYNGYGFYHEMGHASAHLLGIEQELGRLVMACPNAKTETNDNIFCYGAQRLALHEYDRAIAEYAAVAIEYFITDPDALPSNIRAFIIEHWR